MQDLYHQPYFLLEGQGLGFRDPCFLMALGFVEFMACMLAVLSKVDFLVQGESLGLGFYGSWTRIVGYSGLQCVAPLTPAPNRMLRWRIQRQRLQYPLIKEYPLTYYYKLRDIP